MSGVELHPTKGLNPHMGVCPRCRKNDNGEILLLGRHDTVYKCTSCSAEHIGKRPTACVQCKNPKFETRPLGEMERVASGGLCQECKDLEEASHKAVTEGGVYFKCEECGAQGAILKHSPMAQDVRREMGIEPPKPCGVKLPDCTWHTVQEEKKDGQATEEVPGPVRPEGG